LAESARIRQALISALTKGQRLDREELTDKIWIFIAGALRLPMGPPGALSARRHGRVTSNNRCSI
jgi:hypothetical protein